MSDKAELAIKLQKWAFRLNPIPPSHFYNLLAISYRCNEQYEKAIELAEKSLYGNPDQLTPNLTLAASYGSLNRVKKAQKAVEEVMRIDPTFSLEYFAKTLPYKHQETVDEIINALRKAGLPD